MQQKSQTSTKKPSFFGRMWRKQLIMPTEHGSWSWLVVPFLVGAIIGDVRHWAVWLVFAGGFSVFLMRQPATVLYRIRRGRARKSDGPPATAWLFLLIVISIGSLIGLLIFKRAALLWLMLPMAFVFGFYLVGSRRGRAGLRTLWMELAGAIALAGMAPAAFIAADGFLSLTAWMLWLLMGLQNALGAIYVRLRIADTHQRPFHRISIVWWHIGGCLIVVALQIGGWVPAGSFVPFAIFLIRAVWAFQRVRPVPNVKQFGFIEIGFELLGGAWLVGVYWLAGF